MVVSSFALILALTVLTKSEADTLTATTFAQSKLSVAYEDLLTTLCVMGTTRVNGTAAAVGGASATCIWSMASEMPRFVNSGRSFGFLAQQAVISSQSPSGHSYSSAGRARFPPLTTCAMTASSFEISKYGMSPLVSSSQHITPKAQMSDCSLYRPFLSDSSARYRTGRSPPCTYLWVAVYALTVRPKSETLTEVTVTSAMSSPKTSTFRIARSRWISFCPASASIPEATCIMIATLCCRLISSSTSSMTLSSEPIGANSVIRIMSDRGSAATDRHCPMKVISRGCLPSFRSTAASAATSPSRTWSAATVVARGEPGEPDRGLEDPLERPRPDLVLRVPEGQRCPRDELAVLLLPLLDRVAEGVVGNDGLGGQGGAAVLGRGVVAAEPGLDGNALVRVTILHSHCAGRGTAVA